MLSIKNLKAGVDEKEILKGINLEVKPGEVHAIMGPNGSGKSTLAGVLAGRESYQITEGEISFYGKNIIEISPEERAHMGLFLAFNPFAFRISFNAVFKKLALLTPGISTGY